MVDVEEEACVQVRGSQLNRFQRWVAFETSTDRRWSSFRILG
jgi:hypothetical protein